MVDWIIIGQTSGTGNTQILVQANENPAFSSRTTSFVLSGNTKSLTIPVEQLEPPVISIDPDVYNFKASGGTAEFTVTSISNWSVTQRPNWLTLSPTGGTSGTTVISATCATNTEYEPRVSGITVYNSTYSKSASTIITQDEKIRPLVVTPTQIKIPRTGGTRTFQVTSTSPWAISGSTLGTISPSSGTEGNTTVSVTITDENTGNTIIKNTFYVYNAEANISVTVVQKTDDYLTFEVLNTGRIYLNINKGNVKKLYYSKNGGYWTRVSADTSIGVSGTDYVQFKMTRETTATTAAYLFSGSTCEFNLSGNLMSLVDADNFEDIYQTPDPVASAISQYVTAKVGYFTWDFIECYGLKSISDLRMPATALTENCYYGMFYDCTGLTESNDIIPASTLGVQCCQQMFRGCRSLTSAPELPASTLVANCYNGMFHQCSSLSYIKCLATDNSASFATDVWVYGVSESGTFVKASGVSWSTGVDGIPSGWTVEEV